VSDVIITKSESKDFYTVSPIKLHETPTTCLAFYPEINKKDGGIRGELRRLKKNKHDTWEKMQNDNFKTIQLQEGTFIELRTDMLTKLIEYVKKIKPIIESGLNYGENKYYVMNENDGVIITDESKRTIIKEFLSREDITEVWGIIAKNDPNLAEKINEGYWQLKRKNIIEDLKNRLKEPEKFHENKYEDSWQRWIYKNNWIFGVNYQPPIQNETVSLGNRIPDFLFPTIDGFIDILEIKLPHMDVIKNDNSHFGSWVWSPEANKAIGQVVNYLSEIDRNRLEIEARIMQKYNKNISLLKPRAYILIGNSDTWELSKKDGLRKLNNAMHRVEVITYSELVSRGNSFLKKDF
jgi:hypothetical protein